MARVLRRHRAPLVAAMAGVRRDPGAGPRRRLGQFFHLFQSIDLRVVLSPPGPEGTGPEPGATLDDVREAVSTLEDTERTARRFLGGAHPDTAVIERHLRYAREYLCEREASNT